jgi:hypothetical protein
LSLEFLEMGLLMPYLTTLDWISFGGGVISLLALVYSLRVLVAVGRRQELGASSTALTRIDVHNPVLRLLALSEPSVKLLLMPPLGKVMLQVQHTDKAASEATLLVEHGERMDRLVLDLGKQKNLVPLIEGLCSPLGNLLGDFPCPKSKSQSKKQQQRLQARAGRE